MYISYTAVTYTVIVTVKRTCTYIHTNTRGEILSAQNIIACRDLHVVMDIPYPYRRSTTAMHDTYMYILYIHIYKYINSAVEH